MGNTDNPAADTDLDKTMGYTQSKHSIKHRL